MPHKAVYSVLKEQSQTILCPRGKKYLLIYYVLQISSIPYFSKPNLSNNADENKCESSIGIPVLKLKIHASYS